MASPVTCNLQTMSPEDFIRRFVRTDGSGNYALAIKDVTASGPWTAGITCGETSKEITWRDIVELIAVITSDGGIGINAVIL